jgi:hypothetical protein
MLNKISTILFLIGVLIIIILNIKLIKNKTFHPIYHTITIIFALLFMGVGWLINEFGESYSSYVPSYSQYDKNGKLIAGTVYADYPGNVGGLGWIL